MLFIGSCSGKFLALDKTSGKPVWSYDTIKDGGPYSFHGNPLIHGDLVLVPSDRGCDIIGYVYAFEAKSGKLRWAYRTMAPATNLLEVDGNIIVGTRQDEWMALDIDSGKLVWELRGTTPDPDCEFPKAPATDGATVAIVSHDAVIHFVDAHTGRDRRNVKLPAPASTGLFLYKDVFYVGTEDGHLRGLDSWSGDWLSDEDLNTILSGRFSWEERRPGPSTEYAFGSWPRQEHKNRMILAFDDKFEKLLWSRQSETEWTSTQPHPWRSWVIAGNCQGDVVAYRASDGEVAWKERLNGCIRSFSHDDTTLYIGAEQGTVYAYRPK